MNGIIEEALPTWKGTTQRQYLYAAMTCVLDHDHLYDVYGECVPDSVVLGEN